MRRKVCFSLKPAEGFVIMPGRLRAHSTSSTRRLTLIQTGKVLHFPVVPSFDNRATGPWMLRPGCAKEPCLTTSWISTPANVGPP